ncbi:DNA-directed DNA/RNA polymerase mu [Cheilinus undulatus]|uniref:DNA-directed DNA/RNA polymerase mu n=1 Tax=Cheilinus undulatus TaxID=241271 RepID=UPI001BD29FA1|nr:DNA-directed DNA/RNA polymerase mu [Cheilinus undulatus]XP_041667721.1 DNA-directed DNA/RNA polymerase mu [Cheilinus undulatus]XP_041667722.1 DNA-directed DNA/RNA polymerase mu [Cheilinus undulatus]
MVPLKRRKLVSSHTGSTGTEVKFPRVVLFLLERKMGASRRSFLSQLGRKKGFQVEEKFSENVTHVISENNSGSEVRAWLDSQPGSPTPSPHLLDISWFTESMRAGLPVQILETHKLQEQQSPEEDVVLFSVPSYACQRRTTLENHNAVLTDALSLLAENSELSGDEGRGVAFRRAAAVLKSLPEAVTSMTQLRGLPCLGDHSLRVIKDILENGASSEVESTKQCERYTALKVLTGIFGVGSKTADRWIRDGIHNLQQLQDSGQTLNRAQQAGLEHYNDLKQPVTRAEADVIAEIVERTVVSVLPGAQMTLIGGFRRGKQSGHDVDFLITHPEEGREVGLMPKIVSCLEEQGFLLYQKTTRNSYLESKDGPGRPSSNMDRFERCLSIFKLIKDEKRGNKTSETLTENGVQTLIGDLQSHSHALSQRHSGEQSHKTSDKDEDEGEEQLKPSRHKPWRAVRVDLVVSPISQYAFALLGWTGSKLFERELRRWAGHEKSMSLSSHALYDNKQKRYLRATSEEEIFAHLGLEFIPPSERNA